MAEKRRTTNANIVKIAAVAFIALFLVIFGIAQRQAIYDQLYDWKLIPRPERLTELYFSDHTNLPTTYEPGDQQTVKFTVYNLEYLDTKYTYKITVTNEDDTEFPTLASGKIQLAHDQAINSEAQITLPDAGNRSKVVVTIYYQGIKFGEDDLSDQEQSIHYWVENSETPDV